MTNNNCKRFHIYKRMSLIYFDNIDLFFKVLPEFNTA